MCHLGEVCVYGCKPPTTHPTKVVEHLYTAQHAVCIGHKLVTAGGWLLLEEDICKAVAIEQLQCHPG